MDITLRSALTATGLPRPGAAVVDGIVAARAHKERKYSELLRGDRCRLVVVALETGGRWSLEAVDFIERLAVARARDAPPNLQRSAFLSWSFHADARSPTRCPHTLAGVDGEVPHLAELLSEV